ncbi:hypothetical protein [Paenibacillus rhizolycopersici]|uniref:hypothetical protein n=1 Tax=Paenibacillus rhizolycopersici TaxID=2780073 RepID=UPI003D2AE6E8
MELTADQKKAMIQQRLDMYKQQMFSLEMDKIAIQAVNDEEGIKSIDERLEALRKAYKAVEGMM